MKPRHAELIAALQQTPPVGGRPEGHVIQCPAAGHDDVNPSASYRITDDGTVLLHCHARGCSLEEMLLGLGGFEPADAFPSDSDRTGTRTSSPQPRAPKPEPLPEPHAWERAAVWRSRRVGEDHDGPQHIRLEARDAEGNAVIGPNGKPRKRVLWSRGTDVNALQLYRAWDLGNAEAVIVAEGEKTTEYLIRAGLPAVGTYGVGHTPSDEALEPLRGRRVALAPDNDEGGRSAMLRLARRLERIAAMLVWIAPPTDAPRGWDLADVPPEDVRGVIARQRGPVPSDGAESAESAATHPDVRDTAHIALTAQVDDEPLPSLETEWPEPIDPVAYHGILGRIATETAEHTEADPVAVLATAAVALGCAIGRGPVFEVGAAIHRPRLFVALVGRSSVARKGTSADTVMPFFLRSDPSFGDRIISGLGSGEALIAEMKDPTLDVDGEPKPGTGVLDKRALVMATELASILRVASRDGSTLSPVLRDAWDRDRLRVVTRKDPVTATGAHVSMLAHITGEELRREFTDTEMANGFGNRFIWLAVKRARLLASPKPLRGDLIVRLEQEVADILEWNRRAGAGLMSRDPDAEALWYELYPELSRDRWGLAGSLTSRAEAQVLRISMVFALADRTLVIRPEHLRAALALWDYAERSVAFLFGKATGDPVMDRILEELRQVPEMTRNAIRDSFSRHVPADRLDMALSRLVKMNRVVRSNIKTGGRPAEVYRIAPKGRG